LIGSPRSSVPGHGRNGRQPQQKAIIVNPGGAIGQVFVALDLKIKGANAGPSQYVVSFAEPGASAAAAWGADILA
jgi:hypothetical protein